MKCPFSVNYLASIHPPARILCRVAGKQSLSYPRHRFGYYKRLSLTSFEKWC